MGPQLTVLIIEVSLFQSVHNSRFDCIAQFLHVAHVHVYMYSTCMYLTSIGMYIVLFFPSMCKQGNPGHCNFFPYCLLKYLTTVHGSPSHVNLHIHVHK